ncbi:threonine/serine exporter family protein [Agromyces aerolatus]|uniref:threonine/serine ThrE exporter family protein n=1 Tax=Agromyces sp. LY-1074 TaxID=3074080 RepID=UPI00285E49DF|nr:threonine/serine exporter family protein [Agromyces sp. LY-1358]MDR5701179.1 threonine/serine exporter family protein [Agromyces sp. LY-1074]MDR5707819.1 threonine/serine exporter family protein [Agromyces sp. LY-1358]
MGEGVSVDESAILRSFLLGLAEALNASSESVDRIRDIMNDVSRAYGQDDTDYVVLPTAIVVETGSGESAHVALRSSTVPAFRFDQIAALYDLVGEARAAKVEPAEGIRRLNEIGAMRPGQPWPVRVFGHALLTAGLALLLTPTWQGALVAFGLGAVLGFAKLIRSPTLQLVFPVVAAFGSALAVFLIAPYVPLGDPLRLLIAPLATFLPGGVLTTATMELAAGQMTAGASRLVTGLVQLGLLAFGILAAGTILGVGEESYVPLDPADRFPWWAALGGVLLFAVGNFLHFSAPGRTFGWVLLALVVAYAAQSVGQFVAGATVSGFIGALVVTPLVLWISSLRHGAPSQLTFLPAFWLLVPGAAGLVGLTEVVGTDGGVEDFAAALTSVMSIALGVLLGTALYRFVHRGAEEIAGFHIEMPASVAEAVRPSFWARLVHRAGGARRVPEPSADRAPAPGETPE